jgi:hypothetical protein
MIAVDARSQLAALPDGRLHEAIFAAMGALYFAQPDAWGPGREPISQRVFGALGPLARPSLIVHLLRRGGRDTATVLAAARRSRARL